MEPLVLVLVAVVVAAAAVAGHLLKERRRRAIAAWAARSGLRYAREDPFGTLALPLTLLREGDGQGVENVVWGEVGRLEARLFDFWYYEEHTDDEGRRSRSYRRFTCALTRLPDVWCPHLVAGPESFASRLKRVVGIRDIEFESEDFNDAFLVEARDAAFAYALLDARMMAWLLAAGRSLRFEVVGDLLLVASRQLDAARLWDLLHVARGFRDRVPSVVASLHPAGGDATDLAATSPHPSRSRGVVPRWTL